MKNLRLPVLCFLFGTVTDLLVVLYYRSVQSRSILAAMALSMAVTLPPLFVTSWGIEAKNKKMYVLYAAGCSVGTAVGLLI